MSKLTLIVLIFALIVLAVARAQTSEDDVVADERVPPVYYTRLEGSPPDLERFWAKYGAYSPKTCLPDLLPSPM